MTSQLNPEAAVFRPVLPKKIIMIDEAIITASPGIKFEEASPLNVEYSSSPKQVDYFMRDNFSTIPNKIKELSTHAVCTAPEFTLKPQDHIDHIPIAIDKFLGVQGNPREVSQDLAQTALMESILISIEDEAIVDNNNKTNTVFGEVNESEVSEMPEMIALLINQTDSIVDKQIKSDMILPKDEPTKGQKKRPKSSRNKHKRRYKKFEPIAVDNSGFITELRRTPPIDLTFKPIQTFSDDNPFGALQSSAIPTPNSTPMDDYYNLADLYKTPPQSPQREEPSSKLETGLLNIVNNTPPSFILRRSPVGDQVVPFEELESPNEPPPFVHPPNANRKITSTELPKSPELEDRSEVLSAQSLKISLASSEGEKKNNTVGTKHDSIVQTPITKKKNKKNSFSEKKPMIKTNTELNSDEKFFRPEYTIRQPKKESNPKNKQHSANIKTDLVAIKPDSLKHTVDDKVVPESDILKTSSANLNTCSSTNSEAFDVEIASDSKSKDIENMQNMLVEDSSIEMQETSFINKNNNENKQPTEQLSKKKAQEVKEQLPEKLTQELTEQETEQSPEKLTDQVKKQLPEELLKKVTENLTQQLPEQSTEQVKEQLPEKVTEKLPEKVTEQLPEKITEKVTEQLPEKITEQVTEQLPEKITEQVTEQLPEKITEQVTEQLQEMLTDQVTEQLSENLTEQVTENLTEQVTENLTEQVTEHLPEMLTEQLSENLTEQLMEHLQQKLPEEVTEDLVEMVSEQLKENITVNSQIQILEKNESPNINDAKEENQELKNHIHCNGEGEMTLELEDQVSTSPTTPEEIRSLVQGFEVIDRNELIQDDYTPHKIFGTDYRTENAIFLDGDKIINVRVTVKNSSEKSEKSDEINTTGLHWLPLDDTHFADKPQTVSTESTDCKKVETEEAQIVVDDITLEFGEHLQPKNPAPTENKEFEELVPFPKESIGEETIGTTQKDSKEAPVSEMTEVVLTAEDPAPTLHDQKDCQIQNDIPENEISKIAPEATSGESELTSGEEEPLEHKTTADEFVSVPSDLNAQALEPQNLDELASAKKPATNDTTSATSPSGIKSVASATGKTSVAKPAAGSTTSKSAATGGAAKTAAPSKPNAVASKSTTPSKSAASSTPAKSASGTTASKLATTGVAASKSTPSNSASTKPTTSGTASKPAASPKSLGTSVAASKVSSSTAPKSTASATSKPSTTATSSKPAPGAASKPATSSSASTKPTASTTSVKKPVSAALKSSASKTASPSPTKPTVSSTTPKPVLKQLPVGETSALKSVSKPSSPLSNPSSPTSPKSPMTKSIASLPSPTSPKSPMTKSIASLPSPTTPKSPVTKSIPTPLKVGETSSPAKTATASKLVKDSPSEKKPSTTTDAKSLAKKIEAPKSSATTKPASPAKPVSGTKAVPAATKPQATTPNKTTAVKPASATTAAKPASATTAAKPASATTAAKPASATTAAKKPVAASDENSKVTTTTKKPATTAGGKPAEKSSKEPSGAKVVSGKATLVKSSSVKPESKQTTKNGEKIISSKKTEEGKKQEKSVQELKVTTTNEVNQPIIQV